MTTTVVKQAVDAILSIELEADACIWIHLLQMPLQKPLLSISIPEFPLLKSQTQTVTVITQSSFAISHQDKNGP